MRYCAFAAESFASHSKRSPVSATDAKIDVFGRDHGASEEYVVLGSKS